MKLRVALTAFVVIAAVLPASAAEKIKIGFMSTISGPAGVLGKHMKDGTALALENLGGKIGGIDAEIIYGDDQNKPDVGLQVVDKLIKRDKVDFITGVLFTNVLLAVYPQIIKSNIVMIGPGGGPHQIAGTQCSPYFFSTGSQSDQVSETMGKVFTDKKLDDIYIMVPNYNSGKDFVQGFKRYFKGKIIGEEYTPLGQTDYQTEISRLRAAKPKALFVFYPGGMGIQFLKQYDQAGMNEVAPVYSIFTVDETTIPALGPAANDKYTVGTWSPDFKNPANEKFVSSFRKRYGYMPSIYAAQSYDAINLIDSGVRQVKGDIADKKALIAALAKADFSSVRGKFKFNTNHFAIQNFYLFKVGKEPDGSYASKTVSTVFSDHADAYAHECKMAQP